MAGILYVMATVCSLMSVVINAPDPRMEKPLLMELLIQVPGSVFATE